MDSNSTLTNNTRLVHEFDREYHPILITVAIIICVSNCLVIILFTTQESLRSSGNYLLFSLAISDLAVGLFAIPVNITCEFLLKWSTCLSSYCINRFIAISTVYHILWITLEKYTAIIFPLLHKSRFDHTRVKIVILSTWLGSLLMTFVQLIWLVDHDDPKKDFSDDVKNKELIFNIFTFFACFVLPMVLIIFAYASILLRILRRHSSFLRKHKQGSDQPLIARQMPQKIKSALLFFSLLLIFIICWFWWFFVTIYDLFVGDSLPRIPQYIAKILTAFRYSTSFINPMLYTFFKRDFKKALKKLRNGARLTPVEHQRTLQRSTNRSSLEGTGTGNSRVSVRTGERSDTVPLTAFPRRRFESDVWHSEISDTCFDTDHQLWRGK